eukprot:11493039-Karenia_brevis.AAC.1
MISDSKGLCNALKNELPQGDKKSATETPIVEEQIKRMHGRCRWVPQIITQLTLSPSLRAFENRPLSVEDRGSPVGFSCRRKTMYCQESQA